MLLCVLFVSSCGGDDDDEIIDDVNDKQIDNEVDENFIKEDESI